MPMCFNLGEPNGRVGWPEWWQFDADGCNGCAVGCCAYGGGLSGRGVGSSERVSMWTSAVVDMVVGVTNVVACVLN